jgi:hypothetical protein
MPTTSKPSKVCPTCGAPLYFFSGHGVYLDRSDGKFRCHPCTAPSEQIDVFGNKKRPYLRASKSWYRRHGWTPILKKKIEKFDFGTIVSAFSLNATVFACFWTDEKTSISEKRPIYFKYLDDGKRTAIVDYIDVTLTLAIQRVFNCGEMTELELAAGSQAVMAAV